MILLLIGLLVGFYGRQVYDYVKGIYDMLSDKFDAHRGGVVKPEVARATRAQPINLESTTGGIPRPSPNQVALDAMKAREQRLKNQ